MKAALEGLAGVKAVDVDLARDAFTVEFRAETVTVAEMLAAIEALGFSPAVDQSEADSAAFLSQRAECARTKDPIASALREARNDGNMLFLDFFASWCAPCHEFDEKILPTPVVQAALERFHFLRVDTDEHPEVTQCMQVFGLPTIVVLDGSGAELLRHEGLLSAQDLARRLDGLQSSSSTGEDHSGAKPDSKGARP